MLSYRYHEDYKPKNKSIGSVWTVDYLKSGDPSTPEYYTDLWELDWEGKKRNSGLEHPTVKPTEVFAIPMRVHTTPGDICYEPFCGSGSQIIAGERLNRRVFAMELVTLWILWARNFSTFFAIIGFRLVRKNYP